MIEPKSMSIPKESHKRKKLIKTKVSASKRLSKTSKILTIIIKRT